MRRSQFSNLMRNQATDSSKFPAFFRPKFLADFLFGGSGSETVACVQREREMSLMEITRLGFHSLFMLSKVERNLVNIAIGERLLQKFLKFFYVSLNIKPDFSTTLPQIFIGYATKLTKFNSIKTKLIHQSNCSQVIF